eukprot:gene2050-29557_t
MVTDTNPKHTASKHYFNIDRLLLYHNFYADFGPLNLAQLTQYCKLVETLLADPRHTGKMIVHVTGTNTERRSNAAALIGCFAVIVLRHSPEDAYRPLSRLSPALCPFRDASYGRCTYKLHVLEVLRGVAQGVLNGWYDRDRFDVAQYQHFERVENGDLNWHIPGKFLAFAGPHNKSQITAQGYPHLSPEDYFEYFRNNNVTDIVRFNDPLYEGSRFSEAGFKMHEMQHQDGSTPPKRIVEAFLAVCEAAEGAVAVHCKAGLGRTGTLIGCYMMKHWKLTAEECIGWMRVVRPGSVIGPQQYFLGDKQAEMWQAGDVVGARRLERGSAASNPVTTVDPEAFAVPAAAVASTHHPMPMPRSSSSSSRYAPSRLTNTLTNTRTNSNSNNTNTNNNNSNNNNNSYRRNSRVRTSSFLRLPRLRHPEWSKEMALTHKRRGEECAVLPREWLSRSPPSWLLHQRGSGGASVGTGAPVALLKQHGRPAPTKGTRMAPFVPRLGPAAAEALPPPPDAIDSIKVVNFVNEDAA